MKVAIMGAGLSGLACAIELERNGVTPHVFEKRSEIGDRFVNAEALLHTFSRPVTDELAYLAENHQLYLQPTGNIKEITVSSPHETAVLRGHLGFSNVRGRHPNSFEKQLEKQLRASIHFNSSFTYEDLLSEFTHIVLATGDAAYAHRIQTFALDVRVTLKGATVTGEFSRYVTRVWLDTRIAPQGYAYLIPFSDTEANIVLAFPEHRRLQDYDIQGMWARFYKRVRQDLGQSLPVTDEFEVNHYQIGLAGEGRIGNTFFTGNCFGGIMPFLGFGQFASILTGIYAAQDMVGLSRYAESTEVIRSSYKNSLLLRRWFETLDNHDLDAAVRRLNGFWGHKLVGTRVNVLRWAAYAARLRLIGSEASRSPSL